MPKVHEALASDFCLLYSEKSKEICVIAVAKCWQHLVPWKCSAEEVVKKQYVFQGKFLCSSYIVYMSSTGKQYEELMNVSFAS